MSDSESDSSNYDEEMPNKKDKKEIDPENLDSDEDIDEENPEDDAFSKSGESDVDVNVEDDDDEDEIEDVDEDVDPEYLDEDEEKPKKQPKKSTAKKNDKTTNNMNYNTDDDADDEEDDDNEHDDDADIDEKYLQKIDSTLKNRIIEEYHPELQQHNYEEIAALSKIVRDDEGNIIDSFHKTMPFITKYEMTKVIGSRAQQIAAGGKPFIALEPNMIDSYLIALEEFKQQKIPFIIKRPLPNGKGCEYWKVKDLEVF
jgi:DNA-directed RNA polymerase subunit K/omega